MLIQDLEERLLGLLGDNFRIVTDEDGQIVIHTGLYDNDGELEGEEIGLDEELDMDEDMGEIDELDGEW